MSVFTPIAVALLMSTQAAENIPETQSLPPAEMEPSKATEEGQPNDDLAKPPAAPFDEDEPTKTASKAAIAAQDMIDTALKSIDPGVKRDGNAWQMQIGESTAIVVTDPLAERMRIMVPIIESTDLEKDTLVRLMQANFDSALDARYAISRGVLWGTFIHPLTSLTENDFLSGLAQAITVAATYGSSYSSGAIVYGGGDSQAIQQERLFEQLRELNREKAQKTT